MKILLLTQYFPPEIGAAQARLEAQTKELVQLGHEVEVITCMPNYPEGKIYPGYEGFFKTENSRGIKIRRFWVYASQGKGLGRLVNYLSFMITSFFALFQKRRPDLIFVNSGPLFLGIPGYIFSLFYRCPFVFNVSDLWPRSVEHLSSSLSGRVFIRLSEYLETWIYRKATFVNAITEGVFDFLRKEKKVPEEKILRLFNGVDLDLFHNSEIDAKAKELRLKNGWERDFIFIYAGNHGYAHALESVLLAAEILQNQRVENLRFVLIGGGSEKSQLQAKAKEMNLKNVHFFEPVPMNDLPPFLRMADMGLVHVKNTPLAQETRPAKMFPMMAAKLPILFCGFGEGADLLRSLQAGEVLPPENPEALAAAALRLKYQKNELQIWGERGHSFVSENLSTKVLVKNWLLQLSSQRDRR